ncbi:Uncharacterised protein [Vibrio cholerae]|nr:Uncharacterised protein [Vibrio cholerae]
MRPIILRIPVLMRAALRSPTVRYKSCRNYNFGLAYSLLRLRLNISMSRISLMQG